MHWGFLTLIILTFCSFKFNSIVYSPEDVIRSTLPSIGKHLRSSLIKNCIVKLKHDKVCYKCDVSHEFSWCSSHTIWDVYACTMLLAQKIFRLILLSIDRAKLCHYVNYHITLLHIFLYFFIYITTKCANGIFRFKNVWYETVICSLKTGNCHILLRWI